MIHKPGIYDIPSAEYHADPCPAPSLSSGIGRLLLRSPLHAWTAHPRLNPEREERESSPAMVKGTILHRMLLGAGEDFVEVCAENWTTKAAKERRAEIAASGRVGVLSHTLAALNQAAARCAHVMMAHPACAQFFGPGRSEAALVWEEDGVWCRAMVDRLPDDPRAPMFDLKTTGGSAAPEEWQRQLITKYAFQSAFYQRGARALGLKPADFLFVVIECDAPYAVSVQAAAPSLMALADMQVERAIAAWRKAITTGQWPGYPQHIAYVEAPSWALSKAEDQSLRDEYMEQAA